jgi:hypothetical protein
VPLLSRSHVQLGADPSRRNRRRPTKGKSGARPRVATERAARGSRRSCELTVSTRRAGNAPTGAEAHRTDEQRTREADSQEWATLQVVPAATLTQDLVALTGSGAPTTTSAVVMRWLSAIVCRLHRLTWWSTDESGARGGRNLAPVLGALSYTIGLAAHNSSGLPGLRFSRSPKPGRPTLELPPDALAAAPGPTFIPIHHFFDVTAARQSFRRRKEARPCTPLRPVAPGVCPDSIRLPPSCSAFSLLEPRN